MQISLNLPEYPKIIERPEEQQIKYKRTKEALEYEKEFVTLFKKLTNEFPDIAKYLKEIDSQDSATYNHVINVSLQSYVYAKKYPEVRYINSNSKIRVLTVKHPEIYGRYASARRFEIKN